MLLTQNVEPSYSVLKLVRSHPDRLSENVVAHSIYCDDAARNKIILVTTGQGIARAFETFIESSLQPP